MLICGVYSSRPEWQSFEFEKQAHKLALSQNEEAIVNLSNEISKHLSRNQPEKELATLWYLKAFCDFQIIQINYGQVKNYKELVSSINANLQKAIELNPEYTEAHVVKALMIASALPPDKALTAVQDDLIIIKNLDKGNLFKDFVEGYAVLFTSNGGIAPFEQFVSTFQKSENTTDNWWYWQAKAFLLDQYLGNFRSKPDYNKARQTLDEIQKMQPTLGYLRALKPYLAIQDKNILTKEPVANWKMLASDSVGDARNPQQLYNLPEGNYERFDVRELFYYHNLTSNTVWFKFEFAEFPSANFGINLLFDLDGDTKNGSGWMTNREFRYDVVGTLWLREEENHMVGVNGLSSGYDWNRRRMEAMSENVFTFYIDKNKRILIVGLNQLELESISDLRVSAAIGTYKYWEDNIPDKGGVTIKP